VIFDDLRAIRFATAFCPKRTLRSSHNAPRRRCTNPQRREFLSPFHLVQPPKAEIRVCADMSCHLNGACELRADLKRRFANSRADEVQIATSRA